jgi:hypothetical protein
VILNLHKYFIEYPKTLPNHNVAYGAILASYIDTLPKTTHVYLSGCCWGQWGQPEPKGIYYQLKYPERKRDILGSFVSSCDQIDHSVTGVIIEPPKSGEGVASCSGSTQQMIDVQGQTVARIIDIPK